MRQDLRLSVRVFRRTGDRSGVARRTIEPLEDRRLLAVYTVDTADDLDSSSMGSLRWAIDQANATGVEDRIEFDLSGTNTITLDPARGELPAITNPVTFDGNDGGTKITIDGTSIAGRLRTTGLRFEGDSATPHTISDVVLNGFDTGIVIAGTSGASSSLNALTDVEVNGSVEVGIHIQNDFVQVTDTTVVGGLTGVLVDATDAGLDNVTIDGTEEYGIRVRAADSLIEDSEVLNSAGDGIAFTAADADDRYEGGRVEATDVHDLAGFGVLIGTLARLSLARRATRPPNRMREGGLEPPRAMPTGS